MTAQFPPAGYGPPPPGYGPPPPGYGPPGHGPARTPRRGNPVGIVLAAVGGVAALLGTFLPWYSVDGNNIKLSDAIRALDQTDTEAFPKAYFGYMMWVLLGLTIVLALFGNAATPVALACRITAPIIGALGAVLILVSLAQLFQQGSIFQHSSVGLWLVLVGFVVAGGAGILGPLRVR